MKNIVLISFIILSFFIKPNILFSQELPRLIILETMTLPILQERTKGLISHLAEEGYIDGETVQIEIYNAEKDRTRARRLLTTALQKGDPTLVLTVATLASQEAHAILKGTDIPHVFYSVSDPVKAGLINEMDKATGKKITGLVHVLPDEKIINIALRTLSSGYNKKIFNIGFFHSSYSSSVADYSSIKKLENSRDDINIVPLFIEQLDMVDGLEDMLASSKKVLEENRDEYDFIWIGRGPLGISKTFIDRFVKLVDVPIIMGSDMYSVKKGALLTLMSSPSKDGYDTGEIIIDILEGRPIEDIPVTRSKHFQVGINLTTANEIGIIVPSDILDLARNNLVY
ncbi:MAG: hypothetical protein OCD02_17610 [Spirochaetaceae bacterium]